MRYLKYLLTVVLVLGFAGQAPAGQVMLKFDAQTGSYSAGDTITGATSGATATIFSVHDDGTTGILALTGVTGTFQDDEIIYESALGSELVVNGDFTNWTGDNPNGWLLNATEDGNNYVTENAGKCQIIGDGSVPMGIRQAILTASNFYVASIDIKTVTDGAIKMTADGPQFMLNINSTGVKTDIFQPTGTQLYISRNQSGSSCDVTFDDVSVKQVTNAALANGTTCGGGGSKVW